MVFVMWQKGVLSTEDFLTNNFLPNTARRRRGRGKLLTKVDVGTVRVKDIHEVRSPRKPSEVGIRLMMLSRKWLSDHECWGKHKPHAHQYCCIPFHFF